MTDAAAETRADRLVLLLARRAAVVLRDEGRLPHGFFVLDACLGLRSGISFDPPSTAAGVARLRSMIVALVDERKPWGWVLVAPTIGAHAERAGEPLVCIDLQARDGSVRQRTAFSAGEDPQPTFTNVMLALAGSAISAREAVARLLPFSASRWLAEVARVGAVDVRSAHAGQPPASGVDMRLWAAG